MGNIEHKKNLIPASFIQGFTVYGGLKQVMFRDEGQRRGLIYCHQ